MSEFGLMGVDWEERINFERMRRERLAKAQAALAKSDLAALFIFRYEDARYLTGFRCHMGPVATSGLLVTAVLPQGGEPIIFTLDYDYCREHMPWMNPEQIQSTADLHSEKGAKAFADKLRAMGVRVDGKVGVDIWTPVMESNLKAAFPNSQFVDGYSVLMNAKVIKTRDELECLKAAAMITEAGLEAALRILKPGVKECEVLAEAWKTMTALGSEWTQCANIVCSGPYTAPYRRYTSDRIVRKGDVVIMDIGGCYNGYWGDFTRTYICGDMLPTKKQVELHQSSYDSLFAACAASRSGNTTMDVVTAARPNVLWILGHGSGTNPWEPPFFLDPDEAPMRLEPRMEFSLEPYAGEADEGGFRLENNVIIRDSGPEIYSTFPFDARLLKHVHPLDATTGRSVQFGIESLLELARERRQSA